MLRHLFLIVTFFIMGSIGKQPAITTDEEVLMRYSVMAEGKETQRGIVIRFIIKISLVHLLPYAEYCRPHRDLTFRADSYSDSL